MNDRLLPLCVALEGALIHVDVLHEKVLALIRRAPATLFRLPLWRLRGRAAVVRELKSNGEFDAAGVPKNEHLLAWLRTQKASGRRLVLVTSDDPAIANEVARQLNLFDEIVAGSDMVTRFGEGGFDYVGGGRSPTFGARHCIDVHEQFPSEEGSFHALLNSFRVHQWAKNALIFMPALFSHRVLQSPILIVSVLAFVAFSLCASSVYVINDLFDLSADRRHPRKRTRPFAGGHLTAAAGLRASVALTAIAIVLALFVGYRFAVVLCGYYLLTWAYSLRLKHIALVDAMTLAALYTFRIIAGSAATSIPISFWLLAFSIFMFLSLAIAKRYTEIDSARQGGALVVIDRGYTAGDLPFLLSIGVAAGYCTVVVMAFYINSVDSTLLYEHRKPLWLVCPLLLFWISRVWLLTTRGVMPDDPVVFALYDKISWGVLAIIALAVVMAL